MAALPQEFPGVAAAMETVLTAERSTEAAIEKAREAGALLVQRATEHAAEIARRAEERVHRVHDRCAAALDRRVAELVPGPFCAVLDPADTSAATLDAALERVSAWLTQLE